MKEIQLSKTGKNKGKYVALVDDDMFEYLNQWKWYVAKLSNIYYAGRHDAENGRVIFMHRVIMNTPDGLVVDHINHDGLCNIKSNLRNCTQKQNSANKVSYGKSEYRGVSFYKPRYKNKVYKYIRATISVNNKIQQLGNFKTEEEAARAYDLKAKEVYGEFANLNFK